MEMYNNSTNLAKNINNSSVINAQTMFLSEFTSMGTILVFSGHVISMRTCCRHILELNVHENALQLPCKFNFAMSKQT